VITSNSIKDQIIRFRDELEYYLLENKLSVALSPKLVFPNGACKGASVILGQFLKDDLLIKSKIEFVFGYYGKDYTHGWLEVEGYIIDITANQFEGVEDKVIIIPTKESTFHHGFRNQQRSEHDLSLNHHFHDYKKAIVDKLN